MSCNVSFSLDGGVTYSNVLAISYGHGRAVKVAFLYVGPITDFGWCARAHEHEAFREGEAHTTACLILARSRTYAMNKGRLHIEQAFGGLVDTTTYFESVEEGEFESEQANRGATLATQTPVYNLTASGRRNAYYEAITTMKRLCDEDFALVFSTSFGFMSQTVDVTNYSACHFAADGRTAAPTHFVHIGGYRTNNLLSNAFGS
jgi:basic membrane lipoprotein Med (substrate-binding protein (PBP1-ABC) superfamily)